MSLSRIASHLMYWQGIQNLVFVWKLRVDRRGNNGTVRPTGGFKMLSKAFSHLPYAYKEGFKHFMSNWCLSFQYSTQFEDWKGTQNLVFCVQFESWPQWKLDDVTHIWQRDAVRNISYQIYLYNGGHKTHNWAMIVSPSSVAFHLP